MPSVFDVQVERVEEVGLPGAHGNGTAGHGGGGGWTRFQIVLGFPRGEDSWRPWRVLWSTSTLPRAGTALPQSNS